MRNLTQDKTALERYTLKHVMSLIPLIENHLSELVAIGQYKDDPEKWDEVWEEEEGEADFCIECLPRHGGEMMGYSEECIRGHCTNESVWRDLRNFGSEIYDYFDENSPEGHTKKEDYTRKTFEECQEFVTRLRSIRKRLTGDDGHIRGSGEHII